MKLLCFSDTHIRNRGSFPSWNSTSETGYTQEINNTLIGFEFIYDQILIHKPTHVIFAGDLYHNLETISILEISASHEALSRVKEACQKVNATFYLMYGNHDIIDLKNNHHTLKTLGHYGEIIDTPQLIDNIGFIPFHNDQDHLYDCMKSMERAELFIMHQDFQGCQYESGSYSKSTLKNILNKTILAGDIHKSQSIGNIHYIGSLVQNRFSQCDLDNVGGVLIYEKGNITRVKNNRSKHYVKVKDLKQIKDLNPNTCILNVVVSDDVDTVRSMCEKFEYIYHRKVEVKKEVDVEYSDSDIKINPQFILLDHIRKNNPDVIPTLSEIMEEGKDDE